MIQQIRQIEDTVMLVTWIWTEMNPSISVHKSIRVFRHTPGPFVRPVVGFVARPQTKN
jgi:hypothetical protein